MWYTQPKCDFSYAQQTIATTHKRGNDDLKPKARTLTAINAVCNWIHCLRINYVMLNNKMESLMLNLGNMCRVLTRRCKSQLSIMQERTWLHSHGSQWVKTLRRQACQQSHLINFSSQDQYVAECTSCLVQHWEKASLVLYRIRGARIAGLEEIGA